MGVYVGMDVHRKRSRSRSWTLVVTSSATATWPLTRSSWCRSLAFCRRARRSRSRPPAAGAGWWSCWRSWSWSRTWSTPAAVRRLPRPGSRTTRSMRAPWPSCSGPTCSPRPGSPRRRSVTCGRCCATGPAWSGWPPDGRTGCTPCWPTVASRHPRACGPGRDGRGLRRWSCRQPHTRSSRTAAGCWTPGQADRPPGGGDRRAGQADPRVQALMALPGVGKLAAMTLVAEIGDIGRFPSARKLCAWAGLTPRCATPTAPSATATSPSRARRGCVGSCRRPPRRPSGAHCSPTPTSSWPAVGAATSPPWPSPGGCGPVPSIS
jgi:Transposase IS116/IS110/IS902 family